MKDTERKEGKSWIERNKEIRDQSQPSKAPCFGDHRDGTLDRMNLC